MVLVLVVISKIVVFVSMRIIVANAKQNIHQIITAASIAISKIA